MIAVAHDEAVPVRNGALDPSYRVWRGVMPADRALAAIRAWFRVRAAAGRELAFAVEDVFTSGASGRVAIRAREGRAQVGDVNAVLVSLLGDELAPASGALAASSLDELLAAIDLAIAMERPKLRDDLAAERDIGPGLAVIAAPDGDVVHLYDAELALAVGMDGTRGVAQLVSWAQAELGLATTAGEVRAVIVLLATGGCLHVEDSGPVFTSITVPPDDGEIDDFVDDSPTRAGDQASMELVEQLRARAMARPGTPPPEPSPDSSVPSIDIALDAPNLLDGPALRAFDEEDDATPIVSRDDIAPEPAKAAPDDDLDREFADESPTSATPFDQLPPELRAVLKPTDRRTPRGYDTGPALKAAAAAVSAPKPSVPQAAPASVPVAVSTKPGSGGIARPGTASKPSEPAHPITAPGIKPPSQPIPPVSRDTPPPLGRPLKPSDPLRTTTLRPEPIVLPASIAPRTPNEAQTAVTPRPDALALAAATASPPPKSTLNEAPTAISSRSEALAGAAIAKPSPLEAPTTVTPRPDALANAPIGPAKTPEPQSVPITAPGLMPPARSPAPPSAPPPISEFMVPTSVTLRPDNVPLPEDIVEESPAPALFAPMPRAATAVPLPPPPNERAPTESPALIISKPPTELGTETLRGMSKPYATVPERATPLSLAPPPPSTPPPVMAVCPNCKTENKVHGKFCRTCGTSLAIKAPSFASSERDAPTVTISQEMPTGQRPRPKPISGTPTLVPQSIDAPTIVPENNTGTDLTAAEDDDYESASPTIPPHLVGLSPADLDDEPESDFDDDNRPTIRPDQFDADTLNRLVRARKQSKRAGSEPVEPPPPPADSFDQPTYRAKPGKATPPAVTAQPSSRMPLQAPPEMEASRTIPTGMPAAQFEETAPAPIIRDLLPPPAQAQRMALEAVRWDDDSRPAAPPPGPSRLSGHGPAVSPPPTPRPQPAPLFTTGTVPCAACGSPLALDARFCGVCGTPVTVSAVAPAAVPPPMVEFKEEPSVEAPAMKNFMAVTAQPWRNREPSGQAFPYDPAQFRQASQPPPDVPPPPPEASIGMEMAATVPLPDPPPRPNAPKESRTALWVLLTLLILALAGAGVTYYLELWSLG